MKPALHRIVRVAAAVTGVVALSLASACGSGSGGTASPSQTTDATGTGASSEPISVVASINQWGSLAKQIGGDYVDITSILASSNVEAHDFEAQTADVAKLSKAQVVVANGAGYDAWATKSVTKQTALVTAAGNVGASDGDNPHLWFSKDARNAVAQDLADTYAKLQPDHRDYFDEQLAKWQEQEKTLEQQMKEFASEHKDATYAATESVAYYLLADLGMKDVTPKGYAQAVANDSEPAPADLSAMQQVLEGQQADVLVNNPQEASDTTNMVTGVAHKSDVPVIDVTEQMPEGYDTLTDWIGALVKTFGDSLGGSASASSSAPASPSASSSASSSAS
ncbi:metal ABC transporter solute-binding protein, Zn/Mn family [Bifidobacterium avesanii]|uniref:ABC transporter substrate-binding protein n=1 Tax=Bifidobacterium avesanii TaxID=1798157 RepID=A0A7K3THZ6_9BIFI|nr:zinc ABC transporter substrate-binding protein [Bifidobacterium avesanii]KAB8292731.1 ABC transporter substrate-binding protein [Bifidobacterium avesanii]NEG78339.1 ABC transporter substrate-binding protein [Bifidobacterium avesanii]